MRRRIFVDNLGPAATPETLGALFGASGKVESVVFPAKEGRDTSNAHAFVVMSSEREASQAIHSLNNTDWNGSRLTVTHAGPVAKLKGFGGGVTVSERRNRE